MKILFYIIITFLLLSFGEVGRGVFSQSQFQLTVGGNKQDYARCIIQTIDGGYAVAGITSSFDTNGYYNPFYIVKLSPFGSLEWSIILAQPFGEAYSIVQTKDGGYAATGTYLYNRMIIVKLSSSGTFEWSKTITGSGYQDRSYSIIQTRDFGFAIAGSTVEYSGAPRNMYIVKLDSSGSLQWSRAMRPVGSTSTGASSIIQTTDGGYAATGYTLLSTGGEYFYIVKLDSGGTLMWSKTMGSYPSRYIAYSIIQTTDGGYAAAGRYSQYGDGFYKVYIVKLDSSGSLLWNRTIGGTVDDGAFSILQTNDGGYAAAGYTNSFGGDVFIVKLDSIGSLEWSKTVIGPGNGCGATSIVRTQGGGYALTGGTNLSPPQNSDIYIVKFDSAWNTCGDINIPNSLLDSVGTDISTFQNIITLLKLTASFFGSG